MTRTLTVTPNTDTISEKAKKAELFQLMKMLHLRGPSSGGTWRPGKRSDEPGNGSGRIRQSQAACAMLRRYFVLRVAEGRGHIGEESF